jgi:hypothetical protein
MNPMRGGPEYVPNASLQPTGRDVNNALNNFVRPGFEVAELWLLDIPRDVVPLAVVDAEALISGRRSAAVRYPQAAITNLFFANELLLEIRLRDKSRLPANIRRVAPQTLQSLLRSLFTLNLAEDEWSSVEMVLNALDTIRYDRRMECSYAQYQLWSSTIVQQAYLLLHEFGHLVDHAARDAVSSGIDVRRFSSPDKEDEIKADRWAAQRLRKVISNWFTADVSWVHSPMLDLFGMLEYLRRERHIGGDRRLYFERWSVVAGGLFGEPTDLAADFALLDDVPSGLITMFKAHRPLARLTQPANVVGPQLGDDLARTNDFLVLDAEQEFEEGVEAGQMTMRAGGSSDDAAYERLFHTAGELEEQYNASKVHDETTLRLLKTVIHSYDVVLRWNSLNQAGRAWFTNKLALLYRSRYRNHGRERKYLELSIARCQEAVRLTPPGDGQTKAYYFNLGVSLWSRFDNFTAERRDVLAAMEAFEHAIELVPENEPFPEGYFESLRTMLIRESACAFNKI